MSIKNQLIKIKENWLLVVILAALVLFLSGTTPISTYQVGSGISKMMGVPSAGYDAVYAAPESTYMRYDGDFAPGVDERIITKTASLTTEVEKGKFSEAAEKVKNAISASGAFLLNENVNKYDSELREYYEGVYQIKVETKKYDAVVLQLKEIGEVVYFNENSLDITGSYTNFKIELESEKERLTRYKEMISETESVTEKIELNDRIFNQERTVKYLEDAIKNMDQDVDYSTVYMTLREERSDYADVAFIKLGALVQSFVNSINNLFKLVVALLPWAIALWIIRAIYLRLGKRR